MRKSNKTVTQSVQDAGINCATLAIHAVSRPNFPPLQHFHMPHTLAEMSDADSSSIMTGENSANVAKLAYATAEFPPT